MADTAVHVEARRNVLRRLANRHDHFSEAEQIAVHEGDYAEAEEWHRYALIVLRAYRAEADDRKPKGLA
jgi:hypothetical protein